jgi:hypothetical protein
MQEINLYHFHVGFNYGSEREVKLLTSIDYISKFAGTGQYIFVENQSLPSIIKIVGYFNDNYELNFDNVEHKLYQSYVNVSEVKNLERLNKYKIEIEYRLINETKVHLAIIEGKIEID